MSQRLTIGLEPETVERAILIAPAAPRVLPGASAI